MPRTLAQNAQYIAETIKPAIKSAIEAQGVTVPSTDSFLDYADRIGEIEGGGSGYQLKDLPTGAISTVNDAEPLPLNALKVSVEAVQSGSGTPSPSNIRPIIGWNSGEIDVVGKNLRGNLMQNRVINFQTGGLVVAQGYYATDYILLKANTTVTISNCTTGLENWYYDLNKNPLEKIPLSPSSQIRTFTQSYDCYIRCSTQMPTEFQIELGSQATTYEPYQGTTTSLDFPQTIYGAEWDVVDGEMKQTDGYIASYNGESLPSTWISDRDVYASGTTPTTGAEVVYKLATPTTIPLSPLSIRMLQGTNNLYADCGEVIEGEYFIGSSGAYDLYDYIQTDGTQLIDTGRAITAGDVVNTIFTAISGGSNGAYVWGKYADPYCTALVIYPNNGFYRHYDHVTVNDNPVDQTNFTVGKITEDSYTVATTLGGNYTLFDTASVKLYAFSVNGDDYLPCKRRSDGKFGLYDVANSQFLTDSASGNAITGGNNLGVRIG